MATYSNQHWLLSHIRNSFISTDDTGMCETVMASDDLPKYFLNKFQTGSNFQLQQQRKSINSNGGAGVSSAAGNNGKTLQSQIDQPLREVDFVCYPGLDQSDDEDMDLTTQSFDIQMYPEVGAHRFRSNTAQKLEKMDIARRKAARTKCVNYDDEVIGPERSDLFVRKPVQARSRKSDERHRSEKDGNEGDNEWSQRGSLKPPMVKSKLSLQLANSPKQTQNKFMEYARFDGTSHTGIQTKRISVFLSMLPEKERNYPIKICVVASAKISEVIGLVCYKATIQFPTIPLKSIRHYALYMTEDNDDLEDFPPLDNREPCSKFGFSHLTLAERRPLAPVTRIDYHQNNNQLPIKSTITLEEDKSRLDIASILQSSDLSVSSANADVVSADKANDSINYEEHMFSHNEMLEAPMYRTYRLHIIDKRFFRTDVTLGISGERIEIDQHKNAKFWSKQKAVTYPIDAIAFCEIIEQRNLKGVLRIWLKSASSSSWTNAELKSSALGVVGGTKHAICNNTGPAHSPTSPGHYPSLSTPFAMFSTSGASSVSTHHHPIRFKHYDFETDSQTAEHIVNKLNYILGVRSSEIRREFMQIRERKQEKNQTKKQLKMF